MIDSILHTTVSCVANYYTKDNVRNVNLLTWLNSAKYANRIQQLRGIADKALRDKLKAELPAITPCGQFRQVNEKGMLHHSGFLQFDIDKKDNEDIKNYEQLKQQLSKIRNIAYCGLSASGLGYWGLIRIAYPDKHLEHWRYMHEYLLRHKIHTDPAPKALSSLRGYSYDPYAYFNHKAEKLYKYLQHPAIYKHPPTDEHGRAKQLAIQNCNTIVRYMKQVQEKQVDITEGYSNWFAIGCAIAGNMGEEGRYVFHNMSQYHPRYDSDTTNKQYDYCKQHTKSNNIGIIINRAKAKGVVLGR